MAEQQEPNSSGGLTVPGGGLKKYKPDTSSMNWKSTQYMPGIATEVESEWMEKLYQKFKEIDNIKGLIQSSINDLDKDHLAQKQILNNSFDSMINLLEKRRETLLNSMNEKVVSYKKELNEKLTKMTSDRKELSEIKNEYEENINDQDLVDIEKRETDNVKMIDNALKKTQFKSSKLKPKHPQFIIDQNEINDKLNNLAQFILKTEIPDPPIVSVLVRSSENALIEVLMPQKYNDDPVCHILSIYFLMKVHNLCIRSPNMSWIFIKDLWRKRNMRM